MPAYNIKKRQGKTTKPEKQDIKKKGSNSKSAPLKNTAPKKETKDKVQKKEPNQEIIAEQAKQFNSDKSPLVHVLMPYILCVAALFFFVCIVFDSNAAIGIVGKKIRELFFGFFSGGFYTVPFLMVILAVFWRRDAKNKHLKHRIIYVVCFLLFLSAMLQCWYHISQENYDFSLKEDFKSLWVNGQSQTGGGVFGGLLGEALLGTVGKAGAYIIGIAALIVFGLFMFGLTPYSIWLYVAYTVHEYREKRKAAKEKAAALRTKPEPLPEENEAGCYPGNVITDPREKRRFVPDVEVGDSRQETSKAGEKKPPEPEPVPDAEAYREAELDPDIETLDENIPPFDLEDDASVERLKPLFVRRIVKRQPDRGMEVGKTDNKADNNDPEDGKVDLNNIFSDPDGVDVLQRFAENQKKKEQERLSGYTQPEPDEDSEAELEITRSVAVDADPRKTLNPEHAKPEYLFPPLTLLNIDTSPKNIDISEELHTNAVKLVETLRSFKVRTKIVNVSRGPTITRYELAPEEGVRISSISSLVDDIALNLATTGVRIEAPIPGKAAVGIEVPNKETAVVFLRELIDTPLFRQAASRVTIAIGVDVAGEPIIANISKMPHLLIAGATGMGKSVCMNSIIISLLYKASPDEVKLMLIDPKGTEFTMYNGLPHLLVPVVSEPKKAVGSLHWAVTEMERRYDLIGKEGVRDIYSYNRITRNNPDKEFLPLIVIIIDEFADLIMSAPDLESSICRLAQKARAAGMHLIIGTQRPSVKIITGDIKGNFPSRIAFSVASQTDSRVVIDIAGAEKLIGRGDMLYAPVGSSKPVRVQGAFISEEEVENIVNFIKNQGECEYNSEIIESIEKEAERCSAGNRKGLPGEPEDGETAAKSDPMLRAAIQLAVESGKISTSLIGRRLSLGYNRSAKLIDIMEERGIVSAPDGQKPRNVLITREQYMEMVLNGTIESE